MGVTGQLDGQLPDSALRSLLLRFLDTWRLPAGVSRSSSPSRRTTVKVGAKSHARIRSRGLPQFADRVLPNLSSSCPQSAVARRIVNLWDYVYNPIVN